MMIFCRIRRAFLINIAESGLILGNLLSLWINVRSHDRHGFTGSLYVKKRACPEDGLIHQEDSLFLRSSWILSSTGGSARPLTGRSLVSQGTRHCVPSQVRRSALCPYGEDGSSHRSVTAGVAGSKSTFHSGRC